jgi:predicted acyltransferase
MKDKLAVIPRERFVSLDILRGITIAFMIVVNEPGIHDQVYAPLLHADWNGITPTDFVYPSFIFIVGVSIVLAYSRKLAAGKPRKQLVGKILTRSLVIFVVGILLGITPYFDFSNVRIPGVLQRIAIVFFCCSLLFLYTTRQFQLKLGIFILVIYWLVMKFAPVPGYGYNIVEPGRNLAAWLDAIVIPGRMWQGTWDPEGILSTFPAVVTGIAGMMAGHLLTSDRIRTEKIILLFTAGFLSFAAGNIWDWFFPLNKNLWTSSFVLYTAGLTSLALATLYFLVDVKGHKKWAKFAIIFGSNAIAAYIIADIFSDLLFLDWSGKDSSVNHALINTVLQTGIDPKILSLIWAVSFCALCFVPVYILYRKKIFLKV